MPVRVVGMVPVLVVGIIPDFVVGIVPLLVVGIVPPFAKTGDEMARTNIAVRRMPFRFFIVLLLVASNVRG